MEPGFLIICDSTNYFLFISILFILRGNFTTLNIESTNYSLNVNISSPLIKALNDQLVKQKSDMSDLSLWWETNVKWDIKRQLFFILFDTFYPKIHLFPP